MQKRTHWRSILVVLALMAAGCGGSTDDASADDDEIVETDTTDEASTDEADDVDDVDPNDAGEADDATDDEPADASDETDEAAADDDADDATDTDDATDDGDAETSEEAPASALQVDGSNVMIAWSDLPSTPFYAGATQASDPFFHIHTNPASDGFFFSLELYPEWGQAWMGEVGTFEISCSDPATSTGICPYLDPDGPGPMPVLGDDFATTGTITINILDAEGYNLEVGPIVFSDGTEIAPFTMVG